MGWEPQSVNAIFSPYGEGFLLLGVLIVMQALSFWAFPKKPWVLDLERVRKFRARAFGFESESVSGLFKTQFRAQFGQSFKIKELSFANVRARVLGA